MSKVYKAFKKTPIQIQNIAVTLASINLYRVRRGGNYKYYRKYYLQWDKASKESLKVEQNKRLKEFLSYAKNNSKWYKMLNKISDLGVENLSFLPILEKRDIIENLDGIKTIPEKEGLIHQTSGTTGAAMKTVMTKGDMQERWAIVDNYKAQHGFKFGGKTAWFSGKNLISEKDIKKGVCSHYDFINKIRFYSTFHINEQNFNAYWNSLNKFKPEFIVGFPTSVYQICEIADEKGLRLNNSVKVFFSTSETLLPHHREVISRVFDCKVSDHYSASEGAPIIIECTSDRLHMHPLTGIFEVVDENMNPTNEGELLVTSFTSKGTPLIRYRVGDRIKLASRNKVCECGSNFPLVEKIEGRSNDYIYSPQRGRVNLVNIGNSAKGIEGIVCFQVIQDSESEILVLVVKTERFNTNSEQNFILALRERVGSTMSIDIKYVNDIPREKGGKFRVVKNNLKLS